MGYVIVGALAFVLGLVATYFGFRLNAYRKKREDEQ